MLNYWFKYCPGQLRVYNAVCYSRIYSSVPSIVSLLVFKSHITHIAIKYSCINFCLFWNAPPRLWTTPLLNHGSSWIVGSPIFPAHPLLIYDRSLRIQWFPFCFRRFCRCSDKPYRVSVEGGDQRAYVGMFNRRWRSHFAGEYCRLHLRWTYQRDNSQRTCSHRLLRLDSSNAWCKSRILFDKFDA